MADFIPGTDSGLVDFANVFTAEAQAQAAALGIPSGTVTDLTTKKAAFSTAYDASRLPEASGLDRTHKNEARAALVADIRRVKNKYVDTADLSASGREAFGLPPKDDVRTSIPAPDVTVGLTARPREARQIEVERVVAETGAKANPYGMDGAILYEKVGGPAPASPEELTQSMILKRFKTTRVYGEADRGKQVWYAARWQNNKGDKGAWSDIVTAFIP
jgi:hypothetical protein